MGRSCKASLSVLRLRPLIIRLKADHGEEAKNFPDRGNTTCRSWHDGPSKVSGENRGEKDNVAGEPKQGAGPGGEGQPHPLQEELSLAAWAQGRHGRGSQG